MSCSVCMLACLVKWLCVVGQLMLTDLQANGGLCFDFLAYQVACGNVRQSQVLGHSRRVRALPNAWVCANTGSFSWVPELWLWVSTCFIKGVCNKLSSAFFLTGGAQEHKSACCLYGLLLSMSLFAFLQGTAALHPGHPNGHQGQARSPRPSQDAQTQ